MHAEPQVEYHGKLIRHLDLGVTCPECGGPMRYVNGVRHVDSVLGGRESVAVAECPDHGGYIIKATIISAGGSIQGKQRGDLQRQAEHERDERLIWAARGTLTL